MNSVSGTKVSFFLSPSSTGVSLIFFPNDPHRQGSSADIFSSMYRKVLCSQFYAFTILLSYFKRDVPFFVQNTGGNAFVSFQQIEQVPCVHLPLSFMLTSLLRNQRALRLDRDRLRLLRFEGRLQPIPGSDLRFAHLLRLRERTRIVSASRFI